jgi:cytochrome c553
MKNGKGRKSMAVSADVTALGAVTRVGLILLAIVTPPRWIAQPALAAEARPVAPAASIVAGGGVTLHSVNVSFPNSDATFPGAAGADAINNDCLICHSAGMVLNQPSLSRAEWQGVVDQMRNDFKAPFAAGHAPAIVDYLANLKNEMSRSASRQPDVKHGAVIVAQGTTAGAPPCAQCHAFNGVSDASGAFPRLAGQSAYYLAAQLRDFASGVRASAMMSPIAKALSSDDVADVSAYFAGINAPFLPLKVRNAALVKRGEELAKAAGPERLHCDNCHGPGGSGAPPVVPYLAGQHAHYIASTLQMWQEGFRKNSPDAMAVIAKKLDRQDIIAVAAYYHQANSPPQAARVSRYSEIGAR